MNQNKYFSDLMEGLKAASEFQKGKMSLKSTSFTVPSPPSVISKQKMKAIREKSLGVSQPKLAKILGVSSSAVKAWEQGERNPPGPVRRLMELFENDPRVIQSIVNLEKNKKSKKSA